MHLIMCVYVIMYVQVHVNKGSQAHVCIEILVKAQAQSSPGVHPP